MKRRGGLAALAVVVSSLVVGSSGGAQEANVTIIITDAYTTDFPSDTDPITVCVNGADPQVMQVGDQYSIEGPPGVYKFTIFESDVADCSGVPVDSYESSFYAGDRVGLLLARSLAYTFDYDDSCVPSGEARLMVASALYVGTDVYLFSEADGQTTPFALGLIGGEVTSEVPVGTYDLVIVNEGDDPDGPRLATVSGIDLSEGIYTQVFLAGGAPDGTGGFSYQQGPEVCDDAEPPTTETTTTSTEATTSTSTTIPAVAPASASPATPVSGTATFTG